MVSIPSSLAAAAIEPHAARLDDEDVFVFMAATPEDDGRGTEDALDLIMFGGVGPAELARFGLPIDFFGGGEDAEPLIDGWAAAGDPAIYGAIDGVDAPSLENAAVDNDARFDDARFDDARCNDARCDDVHLEITPVEVAAFARLGAGAPDDPFLFV